MFRPLSLLSALAFVSGLAVSVSAASAQEDPPENVARIAEISGTVSTHAAGSQDWQQAAQNYPLLAGSGIWAEPRSHAAVDVAGARVHLDGGSALEIGALNPGQTQLSVGQGAVYLHVYPGATGQNFQVSTPHGTAYVNQPGQYEIVAGDAQHPSSLSVIEGAAQFVGQGANLGLQPGQRGNIAPDNSSSTDAAQPDDFVRNVQAAEQPYQQQVAQTAQYVSPQATGYQDLARYGQWSQAPQYGAVWYPTQVAAGWAPYRYGHWAYIAPWGWTWVDDAPWGFTPFHYGRWVEVGGRWGWVPGERRVRPVYAPALVTFFGDLGGVGVNLSLGWLPLAPEEVYVPPYRHSPRYVREVNIMNVHNETRIVNVVNNTTVINVNNYANRRAFTVVDRDVVANARPVGPAWSQQPRGDDNRQWANARRVTEVPVQPQHGAQFNGEAPKPRNAGKPEAQQPVYPMQQNSHQPNAQQQQGEPVKKHKNNNAAQPYTQPQMGQPQMGQPQMGQPAARPNANQPNANQPGVFYPSNQGGQPNAEQGKNKKHHQDNQPQSTQQPRNVQPNQQPNVQQQHGQPNGNTPWIYQQQQQQQGKKMHQAQGQQQAPRQAAQPAAQPQPEGKKKHAPQACAPNQPCSQQ
jgi:hypothetical protein